MNKQRRDKLDKIKQLLSGGNPAELLEGSSLVIYDNDAYYVGGIDGKRLNAEQFEKYNGKQKKQFILLPHNNRQRTAAK
jgi:hypothetical protein